MASGTTLYCQSVQVKCGQILNAPIERIIGIFTQNHAAFRNPDQTVALALVVFKCTNTVRDDIPHIVIRIAFCGKTAAAHQPVRGVGIIGCSGNQRRPRKPVHAPYIASTVVVIAQVHHRTGGDTGQQIPLVE